VVWVKDENGLTPKQALFVKEYLVDENGTQAAIRAGYSPKYADRTASNLIVKNREVARQIEEGRRKKLDRLEKKGIISTEEVVCGLKLVADCCSQLIPAQDALGMPILGVDGKPLYRPMDPSGATRAYDLLGKYLGMYQTRGTLSIALDGQVDVNHTHRIEGRRIARRLILEEVRDEPLALPNPNTEDFGEEM